jgi:hypothetical protein
MLNLRYWFLMKPSGPATIIAPTALVPWMWLADSTWLSEDDLAAHRSEWVEPIRYDYRGVELCELPPNGQGAAALLALALYDGLDPGVHSQIEAVKIALSDTEAVAHDGELPHDFFDAGRLAARRGLVDPEASLEPPPYAAPGGGTTYVAAVDGDGMAVSLIQSLFGSFGSASSLRERVSCSRTVPPGSRPNRGTRIVWPLVAALSTRSSQGC